LAALPYVGQRLADAFQLRFFLRIGAEVILHLGTDLILGLLLKTV
jgi:hypothetical protein